MCSYAMVRGCLGNTAIYMKEGHLSRAVHDGQVRMRMPSTIMLLRNYCHRGNAILYESIRMPLSLISESYSRRELSGAPWSGGVISRDPAVTQDYHSNSAIVREPIAMPFSSMSERHSRRELPGGAWSGGIRLCEAFAPLRAGKGLEGSSSACFLFHMLGGELLAAALTTSSNTQTSKFPS